MQKWSGRVAVVTGASAGIGAAIAVQLANAGLKVVGLARRPEKIDELKSQVTGPGRLVSRRCDIAKSDEVAKTFQWIELTYGGTDLLVNNAAVFPQGHVTEAGNKTLSEEDLISEIDINIKGLVMCTRHAVNSMNKRKFDGHVININSIAGHYVPFWSQFNVYPATKHAVTAFTRSLINELIEAGSNVKITSLSPGLVKTAMMGEAEHQDVKEMPGLVPQDIADAVMYVISTPKHVQITELTVEPLRSARL